MFFPNQRAPRRPGPAAGAWASVKERREKLKWRPRLRVPAKATQSAAHVLPAKGETAFARHARAHGGKTIPPSHTQVDWRLFVEGEEDDADAAALLADVFGGDAAEDADEAAAAPACGWPRFDASLQTLRDACAGEDAAPVARDEVERFAALVRILVAPRTPSAIVDAAVDALRPTTAAEFARRAQDDVEATLRASDVAFPRRKAEYLLGAAESCAREGDVPRRPRNMKKLPGVGEKGAAQLCVSAWGCDDGGVVVGTSTHRAVNALGWVETSTPTETKKALEAWLPRDLWRSLPVLVAAHVAAPAPAVFDPLLGRGVAVFLPPGHKDRDAVVAACAALGGGGAREYRIHRSKFDADFPDELLASARVDSYGVVEAVIEDLRARRISCYARRVVDGDGEVPF